MAEKSNTGMILLVIGGIILWISTKKAGAAPGKTLPPIAPNLPTPSKGVNIVAPAKMTPAEARLMVEIDKNAKIPGGTANAMAAMTSSTFMALRAQSGKTLAEDRAIRDAMGAEWARIYPTEPIPWTLTPDYEVARASVARAMGMSLLQAEGEIIQQNPKAMAALTPSQQSRAGYTPAASQATPTGKVVVIPILLPPSWEGVVPGDPVWNDPIWDIPAPPVTGYIPPVTPAPAPVPVDGWGIEIPTTPPDPTPAENYPSPVEPGPPPAGLDYVLDAGGGQVYFWDGVQNV